jgi:hypothetical protein
MGFGNIFNASIEYNKLSKSIGRMHTRIQDLNSKIESNHDLSELGSEILVIAYVARKCILDRMDRYSWPWETRIIIPTISRGTMTLWDAFARTVGMIDILAEQLDLTDTVNEIMEKGDAYFELERVLPESVIESF